jgi:hypothetical protein
MAKEPERTYEENQMIMIQKSIIGGLNYLKKGQALIKINKKSIKKQTARKRKVNKHHVSAQ